MWPRLAVDTASECGELYTRNFNKFNLYDVYDNLGL